ncbi:hypothetical protein JTB14_035297 [Gonioctena quinquepunctata]|nr:hypothetical protein JTB14_035297 [Gonioctena quinquepunctata]
MLDAIKCEPDWEVFLNSHKSSISEPLDQYGKQYIQQLTKSVGNCFLSPVPGCYNFLLRSSTIMYRHYLLCYLAFANIGIYAIIYRLTFVVRGNVNKPLIKQILLVESFCAI